MTELTILKMYTYLGTAVNNPFIRTPAQQFSAQPSKTTLNELAASNRPSGMAAPSAQPQQPAYGGSFGGLPAPLIPPPVAPQPVTPLFSQPVASTTFGQPYGGLYGAGALSSGYAAPMQPQLSLPPFQYQPRQAF